MTSYRCQKCPKIDDVGPYRELLFAVEFAVDSSINVALPRVLTSSSPTIMAAISANALCAVIVVASARAGVSSRNAAASMPAMRGSAKSVGFGSEQRRGLAMSAARGVRSTPNRGFEVVAQAISEVRNAIVTQMPRVVEENEPGGRDAHVIPVPDAHRCRFPVAKTLDLFAKKPVAGGVVS